MAEKLDFGEVRTKAVVRTPVLRFEIIRWDWTIGDTKDKNPIDITPAVFSFKWLKSLRNPSAGCEITMIPQFSDIHYLDTLEIMDVVKIYEFNVLKYIGYIKSIHASGTITSQGNPNRSLLIDCVSFGTLFTNSELGLNMFLHTSTYLDISTSMKLFSARLADIALLDKPYSELVKTVIEEWFSYLNNLGATVYTSYFNKFIDYESGLQGKTIPGFPKEFYLFYSNQQKMSLWNILSKVIQMPFNEAWFDCGPRNLWVESNENLSPATPGEVKLTEEKETLVIRVPPFNGTVINNNSIDLWDSLPSRKIPIHYVNRFDLNKTGDEAASFYLVSPPVFNPGELALIVQGEPLIDIDMFNKYLYRPMIYDLNLIRTQKSDSPGLDDYKKEIYSDIKDKVQTLYNWNKYNDQYLSGAFTIMVPSNSDYDPRIGDKLEIEKLEDYHFYVEGVAHSWTYGGPLISNVSVTRGWGQNSKIKLTDKIFRRGKFAMGEKFI